MIGVKNFLYEIVIAQVLNRNFLSKTDSLNLSSVSTTEYGFYYCMSAMFMQLWLNL